MNNLTQVAPPAIVLGLERIRQLLTLVDNPHTQYPIVHVAGTNGKGSVCALISTILSQAGYKTGRFNSPHLVSPHDIIRINDQIVQKDQYAKAYGRVLHADEEESIGASLFELQTATAFLLFAEQAVDIAIIEVGLGGRLDATNICEPPLVCAFTAIGLDHMEFLGDTVEQIAAEKAGIIKPGVGGVVIGPQPEEKAQEILEKIARDRGCPVHIASPAQRANQPQTIATTYRNENLEIPLPLLGAFQLSNVAIAIKAIEVLTSLLDGRFTVSSETLTSGISNVRWPGRLEWVTIPDVGQLLVDGAHNPPAAKALAEYVDNERGVDKKVGWILGFTKGKDIVAVMRHLLRDGDTVYLTPFSQPEGMPWIQSIPPEEVKSKVNKAFPTVSYEVYDGLKECIDNLRGKRPDLLVLCGSLYLVADLYRAFSLPQ